MNTHQWSIHFIAAVSCGNHILVVRISWVTNYSEVVCCGRTSLPLFLLFCAVDLYLHEITSIEDCYSFDFTAYFSEKVGMSTHAY